jgi:hypothetical protein
VEDESSPYSGIQVEYKSGVSLIFQSFVVGPFLKVFLPSAGKWQALLSPNCTVVHTRCNNVQKDVPFLSLVISRHPPFSSFEILIIQRLDLLDQSSTSLHFFFPVLSFVNGAEAVCDQKTSKFFVSHWEESMAGHMGVKGVY